MVLSYGTCNVDVRFSMSAPVLTEVASVGLVEEIMRFVFSKSVWLDLGRSTGPLQCFLLRGGDLLRGVRPDVSSGLNRQLPHRFLYKLLDFNKFAPL